MMTPPAGLLQALRSDEPCATDGRARVCLPEFVAAALAFAAYLGTVAPDLTAGDSGELATAAAVWGMAHPPAYPLWTAAAHFWTRLLGAAGATPVVATNLLSAVLSALAAGVVVRVLRRLTGSATAALAAGLAMAVTGPVWSAAVVTEVYAHALLLLVVWGAVVLGAPPARAGGGRLFAVGLLTGLGLLAHQLLLLPLLLVLPWAIAVARDSRDGRRLAWLALGFAAGLLPLLLIPWRAHACADLRWGWSGLADLPRTVLRTIYARPAGEIWPEYGRRVWLLLRELARGTSVAGLGLAGLGWWALARRRDGRRAPALAAAGLTALVLGALPLAAPFAADPDGISRVAPFLFVLAPALALGWAGLFAAGLAAARARGPARGGAAAVICLLLPAVLAWAGWPYHDRSRDLAARLYAEDLLRCVPTGGTLVVEGDSEAFPLLYLRAVEGRRPDLTLRHRHGCVLAAGPDLYRLPPALRPEAARRVEAELLADVAAGRREELFFASPSALPAVAGVRLEPHGLLLRAVPEHAAARLDPLPWLAQCPDGAGAAFQDYVTRRMLVGYPLAAARRAAGAGDPWGEALARRAVARLGRDVPGLLRPPRAPLGPG